MDECLMLSQSISLAAEKHKNQKRRDGSPYIYHPLHVAKMLSDAGYPVSYQIAGVLHDVLEDTDTTSDDLAVFGKDIVTAVQLVSRTKGEKEGDYVAAILLNPMAAAVKNADKINNVSDCVFLGTPGMKRTQQSKDFAEQYITNAKKYYYRKFSKALDIAIDYADALLSYYYVPDKGVRYPHIAFSDFRLYGEKTGQ